MSGVLWCEAGGWENGHSFSDKDPHKQQFTQQREEKDRYGDPRIVTETFHLCGTHANGLFRSDEKTPPAIKGEAVDSH